MQISNKKIFIASDHGGLKLKEFLKKALSTQKYKVEDLGPFCFDKNDDYPDYAAKLVRSIVNKGGFGILCCRTGIGMSILANRHPKIRAALCFNKEVAKSAREHNNASVLCLPADYLTVDEARKIVETFLKEKFKKGRHKRRLLKIDKYAREFLKENF